MVIFPFIIFITEFNRNFFYLYFHSAKIKLFMCVCVRARAQRSAKYFC